MHVIVLALHNWQEFEMLWMKIPNFDCAGNISVSYA